MTDTMKVSVALGENSAEEGQRAMVAYVTYSGCQDVEALIQGTKLDAPCTVVVVSRCSLSVLPDSMAERPASQNSPRVTTDVICS